MSAKKKAAAAAKDGTISKSAFVRQFPRTMPAKEVVAKAAEQGMTLTTNHVSAVRSESKKGKAAKKRGRPGAATSTAGKSSAKGAVKGANKAAFVRSLPRSMPAKDVVAKAKSEGVKIALDYVYKVRGDRRATAPKLGSSAGTKGDGSRRETAASAPARDLAQKVAGLVIDHGFLQVELALNAVRSRLQNSLA